MRTVHSYHFNQYFCMKNCYYLNFKFDKSHCDILNIMCSQPWYAISDHPSDIDTKTVNRMFIPQILK